MSSIDKNLIAADLGYFMLIFFFFYIENGTCMLCVLIRIASMRQFLGEHTTYLLCSKSKIYPYYVSWAGAIINTHKLEQSLSRTHFHGSKGVGAIEVLLFCLHFFHFFRNTNKSIIPPVISVSAALAADVYNQKLIANMAKLITILSAKSADCNQSTRKQQLSQPQNCIVVP